MVGAPLRNKEETAGFKQQSLTVTQTRILGFEGTIGGSNGDWRAVTGTATSSTVHSEGTRSLSLSGSTSPSARSTTMSTLGTLATQASIDVQVPTSLQGQSWLGQVALTFNAPSAGVNNVNAGAATLSGPVGTFRRYTITIPSFVVTALNTHTYSDLTITVQLTVPSTSGAFLADALTLTAGGGGGSGGAGGTAGGGGTSSGGSSGGGIGGGGRGGSSGSSATGGTNGGAASGGPGGASGGLAGQGGATGGTAGAAGSAGGGTAGSTGTAVEEVIIDLPKNLQPSVVTLGAYGNGGGLVINDGTKVVEGSGGFANVTSVRTTIATDLGVNTRVKDIYSTPNIFVRGSHIYGNVWTSAGLVPNPQQPSQIDGTVQHHVSLDPVRRVLWTVPFPTFAGDPTVVLQGSSLTLEPGGTRGITLQQNARLKLNRPGVYTLDGPFVMEPGSVLEIDNAAGQVELYIRKDFIFRGVIQKTDPRNNVLIGALGTGDQPIERRFNAILVAPRGNVQLATITGGHQTSVYAKSILARPNTTITHTPFDPASFCEEDRCSGLCPAATGNRECGPGEPCSSTDDCSAGLACQNGICADCPANPSVCTTDCPCPPGGACTESNQCQEGDYCPPVPNGWRYGLDPSISACEPIGCSEFANLIGCGNEDSECGITCTDDVPCSGTGQGTCPQGQVCGSGNGDLLGSAFDNVCWDAICDTPARLNNCGDADAKCGICLCGPDCNDKVCGQPSADGCGGSCTGFCGEREPGCTSDLDCVAGTVCFEGGGPRIGLPQGTNVCLPADCRSRTPAAGDCGGPTARCGECPACVPRCDGRQCGVDPVCGAPCGNECANGEFCTSGGVCAASPDAPPVTVPDGSGGTRVVPPLEPQVTARVGALPGRFAVSESGTATYSIPIAVPPGRAGIEPNLSLVYGGDRATTDFGMGWRLDGLSTIARCTRTYSLDGSTERVQSTDGFETFALCLDGKRLMLQPGYVQGTTGAEYRTLIDSFAKIVYYNAEVGRGTLFRAWTKDGRILTYGGSQDSVLATDAAPYTWGLSRVEDRNGNFMTVRYRPSTPSLREPQELQPSHISYTGHGAVAGNREVTFTYEPRPDRLLGFRPGGGAYDRRDRLLHIATKVDQQPGRIYRFTYDPLPDGASHITSATECVPGAGTEICKQPTTFKYDQSIGFDTGPITDVRPGAWLDLNGDGRQDSLLSNVVINDSHKPLREMVGGVIEAAAFASGEFAGAAATIVYRTWLEKEIWPAPTISVERFANFAYDDESKPLGDELWTQPVTGLDCMGLGPGMIQDFNNDGRDDIIEVCTRTVIDGFGFPRPEFHTESDFRLAFSNGNGSFQPAGALFTINNMKNFFAHDLNADGLEDLLYCYEDVAAYKLRVRGENFGPEQLMEAYGTLCGKNPTRLQMDVDGNGTVELVVNRGNTLRAESERELAALFYGPEGPYWEVVGRTIAPPRESVLLVGDFNGDGLPDLYERAHEWYTYASPLPLDRSRVIWLNVGGRFEPRLQADYDDAFNVRRGVFVTDYDHDGRSDVLYFTKDKQPRVKRFSPALDQVTSEPIAGLSEWSAVPSDVDSDGVLDLLIPTVSIDDMPEEGFTKQIRFTQALANADWRIHYGRGRRSGLLTEVQDGLGALTEIKYTSGDFYDKTYTRGTSCSAHEECVKRMPALVSSHLERRAHSENNPIDREVTYTYTDARMDRSGSGWLGFAQRTITEKTDQQRQKLVIEYGKRSERLELAPGSDSRYLYPFAGLATRYTLTSDPVPSELVTDLWTDRTTVTDVDWQLASSASAPRPFPYVANRTTVTRDNDVPVVESLQHFEVDGFGNITLDRVTEGADSTLVQTDFSPPPEWVANWLISLPRTVLVTSSRGGATGQREQSFTYDANGLLHTATRAPGNEPFETVTTYTPDAYGNVTTIEVAAGEDVRSSEIGYDEDNVYPAVLRNARLHTSHLRFDKRHGSVSLLADPNGIVNRRAYDGFGRLSASDGPEGPVVMDYFVGRPYVVGGPPPDSSITVQQAFGVVAETGDQRTETAFDIYGKIVSRKQTGYGGNLVAEELSYDSTGRVLLQTRPHLVGTPTDGVWKFEYDAWNRRTLTRAPDGAEYRQEYASAPTLRSDFSAWLVPGAVEVTRSTDPDGKQNVQVFDRHGLTIRGIDGRNVPSAAQTTDYFYGPFDQLERVSDNLRNVSTIGYDAYGRVRTQTNPNTGTRSYTYNALDELLTATDALSQTSTYTYDVLGRIERLVNADGATEWTYDGSGPNEIGRLVFTHGPASPTNPGGHRTIYRYEPPTATTNRGLLTTVTQILGDQELTTVTDYDELARPRQVTYPSAAGESVQVEYTYANGLLQRVDDVTATRKMLWEVAATEHGFRIKEERRGDGTTTVYGYQPRTDRITSIQARLGTDLVQDLSYQYYANGTVRERHDHQQDPFPEVFAYDELNRLRERRQRQSGGPDRVETFAYDALGNLTQMPGLGTYTFEPTRPQLLATAGGHEYHHDANGNLTERTGPTVPGGSQSLQYTTFDLPSQITPAAGSSVPDVEFEYDASQSRVLKRATDVCSGGPCPSVTSYYAGSLYTRTIHNEGAETEAEHRYRVYAGGGAIAEIVRDTQGALVTTVYPHGDALGSPNVFVNEDGDLTRQGFAPFGQPVAAMPSGDSESLIGFTGHDHDAELGLVNMQGRIYDPTVGRFLTADPIVQSPFWSQGLNRYAYVFNSPMNLVDPSGFSAIGDYFQGLNDAPPEQAVPGYIGTGLVAGLAVMAVYEGVSASFAAGTASTVSTAATQSGGLGSAGPYARGAGAATVAIQRIKAATGDSVTRESGEVPTQSAAKSVSATKAHATSQPRNVTIFDSDSYVRTGGGDVCLEILRRQRAEALKNAQIVAGTPVVGSNPLGAGPKAGVKEVVKRGWLARAWKWVKGLFEAESSVAKGGTQLSKEALKGIRSLEQRALEHRTKLDAFRRNPDAFDNKGFLKNAPSAEVREQIIQGRIRHLENEIRNFEQQIERLRSGGGL
jgi:RHS repeat-associated protein